MTAKSDLLLVTGAITGEASASAALATRIADRLAPGGYVTRDAGALPVMDGEWLAATATAPAERSPAQAERAALADAVLDEVRAAKTLVIGVPVYNFGPSAQIKTWFDHICRAGLTFRYDETGTPVGLLAGRKAWIALASGGVPAGSQADFASTWAKHVLGFVGIELAGVIAADGLAVNPESMQKAQAAVDALPQAA